MPFKFGVTVPVDELVSTRFGGASDRLPGNVTYGQTEVGKLVKLTGDSLYELCAVGDPIEGQIDALEAATVDGYAFGSVQAEGRIRVTLDGLQATPGTGTAVVGDYVVAGTATAKGTALASGFPKVCVITAPASVSALWAASRFLWRIVAIEGASGTVGTTAIIERVNG